MSNPLLTLPGDQVSVPFTHDYDGLRKFFNGAIQDRPAAIVRCHNKAEVALCIHAANELGLRVVAKNGGHKITGYGLDRFQGILLDLSPMHDYSIDEQGYLSVEAGALWPHFFRQCLDKGLAPISAEDPTVGVSGFTLGGGYGWFSRSRGLAIDQIVELELVTADGETILASENQNQELFWALRGAGCGNFGVVTRFKLAMSPCSSELYCGHAFYDPTRAYDIFRGHQDIMMNAPDELSVSIISVMDKTQQVLAIEGVYDGPAEDGAKAMQPYLDLGPIDHNLAKKSYFGFQFSASAHKGLGGQWHTGYVREQAISDDGMKVIAEFLRSMPNHAPKTVAGLECLGGKIKQVPADSTCFTHRDAMWNFDIFTSWETNDQKMQEHSCRWADDFYLAMQPYLSGRVYQNYPRLELEDWGRAYYGDNLGRLIELASKWDPQKRFYQTQSLAEFV